MRPLPNASQRWATRRQGRRVSSYTIDDGQVLLLFDPLAVPREIEELAAGREPVVVLSSPWHERDMQSLVERLDTPVFTPPADEGSPDAPWLLAFGQTCANAFSGGAWAKREVEGPGRRFPVVRGSAVSR